MKTLVIANDRRTADSIMRYYALRELPILDAAARFAGYEAVAATQAYSILIGARPERIIIGGDYLRWHFGPEGEGRLTNLWRMIEASRLRGARVVFN